MIELNEAQSNILTHLFEETFDDDTQYFTLLDITEVYALLLGEPVNQDFYDLLKRTVSIDPDNLASAVFLHEVLEDIVASVNIAYNEIGVEYWELANNCNILKQQINEIIHSPHVDCI